MQPWIVYAIGLAPAAAIYFFVAGVREQAHAKRAFAVGLVVALTGLVLLASIGWPAIPAGQIKRLAATGGLGFSAFLFAANATVFGMVGSGGFSIVRDRARIGTVAFLIVLLLCLSAAHA